MINEDELNKIKDYIEQSKHNELLKKYNLSLFNKKMFYFLTVCTVLFFILLSTSIVYFVIEIDKGKLRDIITTNTNITVQPADVKVAVPLENNYNQTTINTFLINFTLSSINCNCGNSI